MKKIIKASLKLTALFLVFSIGIFFASSVFAEEKSLNTDIQTIIKILQEQIRTLQVQITDLKSQLRDVNVKVEALTFTRTLAFGSKGNDIKLFQQYLIQEGYSIPAGATGYYGDQTRAATTKFQEDHNLDAIGIGGPKTIAKLNEVVGAVPATPAIPALPTEQKAIPATPALPAETPTLFQPPVVPITPITQLPSLSPATTVSPNDSSIINSNTAPVATSSPPSTATTTPTPTPTPIPTPTPTPDLSPMPAPTPTPTPTPIPTVVLGSPSNFSAVLSANNPNNGADIQWSPPGDTTGVSGYRIYANGTITSSSNIQACSAGYPNSSATLYHGTIGNLCSSINLSPVTTYALTVTAVGTAENISFLESTPSNSVSITTQSDNWNICTAEDTDGGVNYEVKGSVATSDGTYHDTCLDPGDYAPGDPVPNLKEMYCDGTSSTPVRRTGMVYRYCPYGCSDGACNSLSPATTTLRTKNLASLASIGNTLEYLKSMVDKLLKLLQ